MTDKTQLLRALIDRPSDAAAEAEILALLAGATAAELNDMLCGVEPHGLYDNVDNHPFGPRNRDAFVQLLARDRRPELTAPSAAGVVYALQRGLTDASEEAAIRDLLLATRGEQLTRLKNQINDRVDHHDLEGLVFGDLGEPVRSEVLAHIAAEASGVVTGQCKVLIDIDDTTLSSIHDRLYPRGAVYPGALPLYEGLDLGASPPPFSTDDLIFVTARPGDALGLIHDATSRSLRKAGVAKLAVATGTLLGTLTKEGMAEGKLANIRRLRALFPEYGLLFLGDSGQGDVIVARQLVAEFGGVVAACFIHDVVGLGDEERAELAGLGIHVHDTHVGAALIAWGLGLIGRSRLDLVIADARARFDAIEFRSPDARAEALAVLERDIALAAD